MKYNKKIIQSILILAIIIISNHLFAQGIRFEQNMNLEQIEAKAKAEHKYIFVDCYATWCGPCKKMDQETYNRREVGEIYNKQFISVKVQMDRTLADNQKVKSWYGDAADIENGLGVNVYPTFLFLDANGKPVHKATGFRDSKEFVQLAADALNPQKQYYSVMRNFKPEKMDTTELKSLARTFFNQDKSLAGKLALAYLTRIPNQQLDSKDNHQFMIQFQMDPQVQKIAENYLGSLDEKHLSSGENLDLVIKMAKDSVIHKMAIDYIKNLPETEISKIVNLDFFLVFQKDHGVRKKAKNWISQLLADQWYKGKEMIYFLQAFTDNPNEPGFVVFYQHPEEVNAVIGNNDFAQSVANDIIKNTEFTGVFDDSQKDGKEPNWIALRKEITEKYNTTYADRVVLESKLDWYRFLTKTKKDDQSWTHYIACRLEQVKTFKYDTLENGSYEKINQIAWIYVFHHATDQGQLDTMISWMKSAIDKHPNNYSYIDTYACLLYKTGKILEALNFEEKAVQVGSQYGVKENVDLVRANLKSMQKGEPIWLGKN